MIASTVDRDIQLTPTHILETGLAFWSSKVLLSATKLGLFTFLANGSKSAEEIRKAMKLHRRGLYDFLDALVALGFLQRTGLKETAIYNNAPDTQIFLNRHNLAYVGGLLEMANDRLYRFWGSLEEALHTGCPQNEMGEGAEGFDSVYSDEAQIEAFIAAMAGAQSASFAAFASSFDFSIYNSHCDIGGAGGHLSAQIVKQHPHMFSTTFDLPVVAPVAQRFLYDLDVDDKVEVISGDFFNDPFPTAEVITMANVLHDWDGETKRKLIKTAYEALPEGGAFVAIENVIDDERKQNKFGLLMSLNMLIETKGGFDYTASEFIDWARTAGFSRIHMMHLTGPASALVAYK